MKITASSVLFYPLYPGVQAHFFIEGAHGTSPHPILGFTAEVAVNVLVYVLICLVASSVFSKFGGSTPE
jgi:hypothetical protein